MHKVTAIGSVLALGAAFLVAPTARAQSPSAPYVETRTATGSEVWFPVDRLSAPDNGAVSLIIKGRPGGAKMGLMRPRFQFVTEMLKSVEAL